MTTDPHSYCSFHPKQLLVGVCAFCLNDRLLILASKHPHSLSSPYSISAAPHFTQPPAPNATLFNVLRFLHRRLQFRHPNPEHSDHEASPSHEESFISIKFERNGVGSWEKSKDSKVWVEQSWNHDSQRKEGRERESRGVIEHGKPRASMRWRKRIGQLFQVMRWWKKRGSKVEGVKERRGWIRRVTKKRMTTAKARGR